MKEDKVIVLASILFLIFIVGYVSNKESECENKGGVLTKTAFSYSCVKGEVLK